MGPKNKPRDNVKRMDKWKPKFMDEDDYDDDEMWGNEDDDIYEDHYGDDF